jgi:hypothetical protein
MMKHHMEYVYDTRKEAEKNGKEWRAEFGYNYKIVEEVTDGGLQEEPEWVVRFRLILDTDQNLMG